MLAVRVLILQVAVTDLSPAGPIQAVEIQVDSSSLADMCRAHHAIVGRMQVWWPIWIMWEGDSESCGQLA
jgi:hypothetical protein